MAQITFSKFDLGIDHRKGDAVSDANRLLEMSNAYVTTGNVAQKRPGFVKIADLEAGTKGLVAALGKLNTFYVGNEIKHSDKRFTTNKLVCKDKSVITLNDIMFADVFNGALYIAADHGEVTKHHYLNNKDGATEIEDENCPHTAAVLKAESKIFAISPDGSTIRYSKTGDPTVWTGENDAGFLPTGLNARGDRRTNALGLYQRKLVALSRDSAQIWNIDPDPKNMGLDDIVHNVGTSYPESLSTVSGDLYFLSDYGFRSITTQQLLNQLADVDIGSPIDKLVRSAIKNINGIPRAVYFYGTGQYLCTIDNQLFVYSVSRTAKIAAWSRYEVSFPIEDFAELDGILYVRSGDSVYALDEETYTDAGEIYEMKIELPYMDFQSPGQLKRIYGIDLVLEGECYFSVGFDVRNKEAATPEVRVRENTRPGGVVPLEVSGTEFSARFRNCDDKPFRLDALTIYYENLGAI